jgi:hypothetical protein
MSMRIQIGLPDTSTPAGVIQAMAAIVAAVVGDISPGDASDLTTIIDAQRRAIEPGDHETHLQRLEQQGKRTSVDDTTAKLIIPRNPQNDKSAQRKN